MSQNNPYQSILDSQITFFNSTLKSRSIYERKQTLKRLRSWLKENQDLIRTELHKDLKRCDEDLTLSEIRPIVSDIKDALKNLRFWAHPERKKTPLTLIGTRASTIFEAKGNTLIIAPWNFPFQLAIGPLVSAIAAGCTAVIKPSEHTPYCEQLIVKLVQEVFQPNEVTVVTGGVQETSDLLALKWNHIFFTGSPQVGKIVMKAAAEHLTSVTLELGGENPVIVDKKTKLKDTAQKLIWGKYYNCGQSCISPNAVFVPTEISNDFKKALLTEYKKVFGTNEETKAARTYSRIVNGNHFDRISTLLEKSVAEGASIIAGGHSDAEQNYIAPTIIENVTTDHAIFKEEIFGPILPIYTYSSLDSVIDIINSQEKPLALYIFSKSKSFAKKIIERTSAGTTVINDTTLQFTHPNLPFGGVNNSGIGKSHGEYGYREFSNERAILKQRRGLTSAKLIYPPFTKFRKFVVKVITWWI